LGCLSTIYRWLRLTDCHTKVEQSLVYKTTIVDERLQLLSVPQIDLLLKDYDLVEGHHRNAGGQQSVCCADGRVGHVLCCSLSQFIR